MDLSEVSQNPNRHPWEMSRADFLLGVLGHIPLDQNSTLLDVGAGDLYFSIKTQTATKVSIDAVDNAFDDATSRMEGIRKIKHLDQVLHMKYDVISAMDVLEHVENDREFLNTLIGMLKPGATLLLTVPAFQILFSLHDLNLRHFRRYHRGHLEYLIDSPEQIEVVESFYFFHLLFYVRIIEKLGQFFLNLKPAKEIDSINRWRYSERHPLTRSLGLILTLDAMACRSLAKLGLRIPGLSLCMVIRKKP